MAYTGQQGKSWLEENLVPLIIIAIIGMVVVVVIALAASSQPTAAGSAVTVKANVDATGIKVYVDSNRTAELTYIDWGTISPSNSCTVYAYLYTPTTMDIAVHAGNWQPEETRDALTFTYTISTHKLLPDTLTPLNLTLSGDQILQSNADLNGVEFTFDITIIATESPQRWLSLYNGWQIYIDETNIEPTYIGINVSTREILIRANLSDLKADIDEAER